MVRLSEGVEWGLHAVVLLAFAPPESALSAARLAEYHGVPAPYLAKHLQTLARAGILEAVRGPRGGYRLARPADEIRALDVLEAIDGDTAAFRCTEIRRRGPAARPAHEYRVPCGIHALMLRADAAWRAELARNTVADIAAGVMSTSSTRALELGAAWLQEVTARCATP